MPTASGVLLRMTGCERALSRGCSGGRVPEVCEGHGLFRDRSLRVRGFRRVADAVLLRMTECVFAGPKAMESKKGMG